MIAKEIFIKEDARKQLREGIKIVADAVGSTLGPQGQTVLIESENVVGGLTVTKDGVTVLRSINLLNPVHNLAANLVRQAAERTVTTAGDGTTTSAVLTNAIIESCDEAIGDHDNRTEILRNIISISEDVEKQLTKMSKKVTGKKLYDIATISANNDATIGKIIGDVYTKCDIVTVENGQDTYTFFDVVDGVKIDRGFSSKWFINNQKNGTCVLENPYILITDHQITNLMNLENILAPIIKSERALLIIGELDAKTLATILKNVQNGSLKCCNIIPPSFGYRKDELMSDIAAVTGGKYYAEHMGDNLALIKMEDLGTAAKVIVAQDKTTVIKSADAPDITNYISELKVAIEHASNNNDIEFLNERIANIAGSIGIIKVGANTDIERKELKDRIDDAVLAVKAAIEDGILPGGGISLINAIHRIYPKINDHSHEVALNILESALQKPFGVICKNAGKDPEKIARDINAIGLDGYGYDFKNDKLGDLMKMGIIDPTKVTKQAFKNAVSVATTILSTDVIISNVRA